MQTSTYQQVNHYYPYGGLMGESTGDDVQSYKYNGKELERMHGRKKANTESGKKLFVTMKGSWNMYRQGLLEKKYAWNSAPGSIGFTY